LAAVVSVLLAVQQSTLYWKHFVMFFFVCVLNEKKFNEMASLQVVDEESKYSWMRLEMVFLLLPSRVLRSSPPKIILIIFYH